MPTCGIYIFSAAFPNGYHDIVLGQLLSKGIKLDFAGFCECGAVDRVIFYYIDSDWKIVAAEFSQLCGVLWAVVKILEGDVLVGDAAACFLVEVFQSAHKFD